MSDQLYLSLWFPNFRLAALPQTIAAVMHQFARVATDNRNEGIFSRVAAATVYPIDWRESPSFQRIFVNDPRSQESQDSQIDAAVTEATEQLHDDCAYEFEMRWPLWLPEALHAPSSAADAPDEEDEDFAASAHGLSTVPDSPSAGGWTQRPVRVRIIGFGPDFDAATYDSNGHIRIDFGLDTPWTFDEDTLDGDSDLVRQHLKQNVEKLLAFTLLVEKHAGISSRLLWTESGEPLAEKLVAQLQRVN